jgi:predicted RNA-binding Zn-ribbon protein involved in translation (DUF1610 family)
MTPPRLVELECPGCGAGHWRIDSDAHGGDLSVCPDVGYGQREYACPRCGGRATGWSVMQLSPPEFLLQPHDMYPMTRRAFAYWAGILRTELPDHPLVPEIGRRFTPNHHFVRSWVGNILGDRSRFFGRIRRRVRRLIGTGS